MVFKVMLSRRFSEGSKLAAASAVVGTTAVEIPLPDDDPKAMSLLCLILHFRYDDIPAILALDEVLNVTILADKYACTKAIGPVVRIWT